ncbi:MAG: sugar-binding protein [Lachnospiraceae bacterium]|nr:sugar-binding protein [Lachnospiraceae bacterium]
MIKKYLAFIMTAALSLSMVGCAGSFLTSDESSEQETTEYNESDPAGSLSDAAKNHADDGKDIIGISMPAIHLPRWNWDGALLKTKFEERGYTVNLKFADNTIDKQQTDIHELINEGVDILLIAAVKGDALAGVLEEAKAADIPVIAYDRIIESDSVKYYVSFDNDMVGALQGEYIRDKLDLDHASHRTFNIEIVSGDSNDKNADGYYNGAMKILKPYLDSGVLKVLSGEVGYHETETFQWSTDRAEERMTGIITSYYPRGVKLDAVLCANDTAALGVARAIKKNYAGNNKVLLTGQDGDVENLKNIMDGLQSQTSYKCLPNETKVMVDVTTAFMNKDPIDEKLIEKYDWDFEVVYADDRYSNGTDYMKSFLLTPLSITRDNLISELVDKGYYRQKSDGTFKMILKNE